MLRQKASLTDIEFALRSGGKINDQDARLSIAKDLERLGLLRLSPVPTVRCALEGDPDFDDLTEDQIQCPGEGMVRSGRRDSTCSRCGRRITLEGKRIFPSHLIKLDWHGIVGLVRKLVRSDSLPIVRGQVAGVIQIRLGERLVRICIPEACEEDIYLTWYEHFADPIIYMVANTGSIHKKDFPTDVVSITLADLLSVDNPSALISNAVKEATEVADDRKSGSCFADLSEEFDQAIKSMTSSAFEGFIEKLLENARHPSERLEAYKRKLSRRSGSLLGALIRVIGGSGAEDIMVEPKAEYLASLFSSSGTYEMKKYNASLKLADLRELIEHCEQRNTPGILFTSTNRIARSVWSRIRYIKNAQGAWKYIVIDRNLLFELLVELGLTNMLSLKSSFATS